ncbi:MAG: FAD synthetase family protein [Coprothermobacterota bacterium]|nr:FAD synthetase family protein [Coprothermobacterota bacterium]
MEVRRLPGPPWRTDSALGIGVFDGLHRGHLALIEEVHRVALTRRLAPAALTFDPPPPELWREDQFRPLLSLEEKVERFLELGIEVLFLLSFTQEVAAYPAAYFAERLVDWSRPATIVVGENFTYGRRREGNPIYLQAIGQRLGFTVTVLPLLKDEAGATISASRIRQLLLDGAVEQANALLGSPYQAIFRRVGDDHRYEPADRRKILPPNGRYTLRLRDGEETEGSLHEGNLTLPEVVCERIGISFLSRL